MRLGTFSHNGRRSFGVVTRDGICDSLAVWPNGPRTVVELLRAGSGAMQKLRTLSDHAKCLIPHGGVQLLAPVPDPPKLLALAGNYVKHIKESRLAKGLSENPAGNTTPRPFMMPPTVIAGPGDEIPWPCYSQEIDYEVELAVVIGSVCKCVPVEEASSYIAGYTIANDISARSVTFADNRAKRPWDEFYDWLNGKWADGFCPLGPYLVTADEVGDPRNLAIELTVNGKVRQKDNSRNMVFNVYQTVSFISHLMTLTAGDVIATGTPSGVGMADGNYLAGGDVITCRIEKIGELTNTLAEAPREFYRPCVDTEQE